MIQLKFSPVAAAAFFAAVTIASCSKAGSETVFPDDKQPLPVPSSYTVSSYWTTAEISWDAVAECEYYRCELFSGDAPQGDPVYETTVDEPLVLLEDLVPGVSYTMELYACPSGDSVDYTGHLQTSVA